MVLGLRTKSRSSPSVQLDYVIHIQEIKPWPPSQSLRTLRAVVIQWEHGERNTGSTNQVVPSLGIGSGVGDGRIEFNESFRLNVTLLRELSMRGGEEIFQKNCVEFNLYEPRRDKAVKGQLLGTAVVDLADYGIVKESLSISAPINCKRTYRNTVQPVLFLQIQPIDKSRSSSSSRDSLMREPSMGRNNGDSVSALMTEEYAEEAEVASSTDDDISSHSSLAVSSSAVESNGYSPPPDKGELLQRSSNNLESHAENNVENVTNVGSDTKSKQSSEERSHGSLIREGTSTAAKGRIDENPNSVESNDKSQGNENVSSPKSETLLGAGTVNVSQDNHIKGEGGEKHQQCAEETGSIQDEEQLSEDEPSNDSSQEEVPKQVPIENGLLSTRKETYTVRSNFSNADRLRYEESARLLIESKRSNGSAGKNQFFVMETHGNSQNAIGGERKDVKLKESRSLYSGSRIQQLEQRIKMLEGELREAAAAEVSLYSVIAEHGSSMTKVHAPARRISRLYIHACNEKSQSRRGNAAKSAVSGLALVAKACGNDVPRLTFWLSNSIVLRAIISKSFAESHIPSVGPLIGMKGERNGQKKPSPLKWESTSWKSTSNIKESFNDWENPLTFAAALEKLEAWIFSRIVESIWWQTFTPHMQSGAAKAIRRNMSSDGSKLSRRTSMSGGEEQSNFSLELWKQAFRDACERICPVRAEGHECGCLPLLSRLIMEQCIARLDVAMFNAILRESADEIPTDPVADPISDAEVLPIPAGNASFGGGAQLKTAIGSWSRWLTDLFGIDDDDPLEDGNGSEDINDDDDDDQRKSHDTSFKPFHLLNALSDLMMLPKDMLLSRTIRKEVCPTFGPPLLRRVLNSFTPDEFCPDPIPRVVLEALNSEDPFEDEDDIVNFPCAAPSIMYMPPSAASVAGILGEIGGHAQLRRTGSSVLKKSHTSDDELDELDSPLESIITDNIRVSPSSAKPSWTAKDNGSRNAVRYQLLREVWTSSD